MKSHRKIEALLAASAALALSLTACSSSASSSKQSGTDASGGTFRVVMIAGQTGPLGPTTADMQLGLQSAADVVNAAGGILGKKVTVEVLDDKGDPTQGVTQLQKLLTSGGQKPDLVYPGIGSSETLAMLPILTQDKIFSMAQTTSAQINSPKQYPYHFGVNPINTVSLSVLGTAIKSKGYKKVALLVPSNAYGDDLQKSLTNLAQQAGANVVTTERFDPNGVNYTVQYQRALQAGPDVVFADSTGSSTIAQVFQARLTANGQNVPLLVGNGFAALTPSKTAPGGSTDNCQMPVASYVVQNYVDSGLISPLAAAVKSKGQTGNIYDPGMSFDIIRFAAFAAKKAGSTDPSAMAKALEGTPIPSGYSVEYPSGVAYSGDSHFPTTAEMQMLSCTSKIVDNTFWAASK